MWSSAMCNGGPGCCNLAAMMASLDMLFEVTISTYAAVDISPPSARQLLAEIAHNMCYMAMNTLGMR